MSPQEFLNIFPSASRQDLATITGQSLNSVDRWFMDRRKAGYRQPSRQVEIILDLYAELQRIKATVRRQQVARAEFAARQGCVTTATRSGIAAR